MTTSRECSQHPFSIPANRWHETEAATNQAKNKGSVAALATEA